MKLAFIAFLLVLLVVPLARASVGLGVSDYDTKVIVNRPISFAVGKVTNTGNETLVFSYVWKQTNATANMILPVTVGENCTVLAGQSFEPTITIGMFNESFAGNYTGIVQIKGSYPAQGGGNQVVPGGMVHVTLIVNDPLDQQKQDTLPFVVFVVCILVFAASVLTVGVYFLFRKRHVPPSGPFRQYWRKL